MLQRLLGSNGGSPNLACFPPSLCHGRPEATPRVHVGTPERHDADLLELAYISHVSLFNPLIQFYFVGLLSDKLVTNLIALPQPSQSKPEKQSVPSVSSLRTRIQTSTGATINVAQ